jgi:hypothetical protein
MCQNKSITPGVIDSLVCCHNYDEVIEHVITQLECGYTITDPVLAQVINFALPAQRLKIKLIMDKRTSIQHISAAM